MMAGETGPSVRRESFDLLAPATWRNPYPHYERMRRLEPIHHHETGVWLLFRYEDVKAFYGDPDRFRLLYAQGQLARFGPEVEDETWYKTFKNMIAFLDEPNHTRIRRIFAGAFTIKSVNSMRPAVQQICDGLVEDLLPRGEMDLVTEFAEPLTISRIGELLGVDVPDRVRMGVLARRATKVISFVPLTREQRDDANEATQELVDYFAHLARRVRAGKAEPSIFSTMVAAVDADETLNEAELYANAIILYAAGFDTTSTAIPLTMTSLWKHPEQLEIAAREPEVLASTGLAELLRFDTSAQGIARMTVCDVTLGATTIPAGSPVIGFSGSANRDPSWCADPDTLDLRRETLGSLVFGYGLHHCLGHSLAKQELEIGLRALLDRFPRLEPDTLDNPMNEGPIMRQLLRCPVRWAA